MSATNDTISKRQSRSEYFKMYRQKKKSEQNQEIPENNSLTKDDMAMFRGDIGGLMAMAVSEETQPIMDAVTALRQEVAILRSALAQYVAAPAAHCPADGQPDAPAAASLSVVRGPHREPLDGE